MNTNLKFPFTNTEDYDREDSPNFDIPNISVEPAHPMPQSNDDGNRNFTQTSLHLPSDMFSGHHRSIVEDYSSGSDYTRSPSTSYRSLSPEGRTLQHDFDQPGDYEEQIQYSQYLLEYPLGDLRHSQSNDSIHSLGSISTNASESGSGSSHYITSASSLGSSVEKLGRYVDSLDINTTETQGATTIYHPGHSRTVIPEFTASGSGNNSAGVSIRDMLTLLLELGSSMASKDPDDIRKTFIKQLMISGSNPVNEFSKPTKMEIGTAATLKASHSRRKCEATFVCELCAASFTRKNGVMNHYRSHLGIADKRCMFCRRGFTTSLGRHIKKCKSNPNRSKASLKKEVQ